MKSIVALFLVAGCHAGFVDERSGGGTVGAGSLNGDAADLGPGTPIGSGHFVGRAGHVASGGVTLVDHAGVVEIRMGDDFAVSDVPGPVVVLTPRAAIGTAIDPVAGDLEVATLLHPQGAQAYLLALQVAPPPNVFIFCKPYGLEVGKAEVAP